MTNQRNRSAGVVLTVDEVRQMRDSAERLQRDFAGTFNTETIERLLEDSERRLSSQAMFSMWLPVLIERLTRDRLHALIRLDDADGAKPAVLFLCVHNAGRSQMAAGWTRHLTGDRVDVFSGGSTPAADTNAGVVTTMAEVGIDISTEYPKPWTDELAQTADVIVTMGCGDACPISPGKQYQERDVTSPTGQPADVLAAIRDDVRARVETLLATLGVTA